MGGRPQAGPLVTSTPDRARPVRVLHIVPDLGVGGLPRVVETLCTATDRERFDVGVLCLEYVGALGESLRERGFHVDIVPNAHHPDRLAPFKVTGYLLRRRVDVVHTHNTQAFLEGLPGALVARVPVRIHTDHARKYPDHQKLILAERIMARFATRIVAVSDTTAQDLQRYQKIPASRISIIANGVEGQQFSRPLNVAAKRRELGIPPEGPVVGLSARLVEEKGITYLLQAMPRLLQRFPDLHVLIAGEGQLMDSLIAEARRLGVAGQVHFLGLRRDIPDLLRALDIFLLPSVSEGLPMALLEAMAAGLPLIATEVGGVATAVCHGVNGLLIPPANPNAISSAVETLLTDRERLRAFGGASRRLFAERFSAEAMARAYETLYLESFQPRRRRP